MQSPSPEQLSDDQAINRKRQKSLNNNLERDLANMSEIYRNIRDDLIAKHKGKTARINQDLSVDIFSVAADADACDGTYFIIRICREITDCTTTCYYVSNNCIIPIATN